MKEGFEFAKYLQDRLVEAPLSSQSISDYFNGTGVYEIRDLKQEENRINLKKPLRKIEI
jgi:hypothetical protein